jgi:hypothetical protein
MSSGSSGIFTSLWRICRCDAEIRSLNGSTDLNQVVCHLLLSVLPTHIRDIFAWKNPKKWSSDRIHPLFLLFYAVSIALISNHHKTLLTRFWFDVYSPRYLYEQQCPIFCCGGRARRWFSGERWSCARLYQQEDSQVSSEAGKTHLCRKIILCTTVNRR